MTEINETGNVYGKLRVLRKATDEERGKIAGAYWVCQCECGNTIVTNGRGLRSGDTKSCGCLNREHVSRAAKKKVIDLKGMRFGSLTVLDRAEQTSNKYNYALWNCQCDCGETKIVRSSSLLHGRTQSCGCIQKKIASENLSKISSESYIDEIGNKYGRLTVLSKSEHQDGDLEGAYYICQCSCELNTIVRVRGIELRNGHKQSCGCIKSLSEQIIKSQLDEHGVKYIQEYRFSDLYDRSSKTPLRFDFAVFKEEDNEPSYLIEYNGEQHYRPVDWFGGIDQYESQVIKDDLKKEYCLEHGIPLIIIPYTKENITYDDIDINTTAFNVLGNQREEASAFLTHEQD